MAGAGHPSFHCCRGDLLLAAPVVGLAIIDDGDASIEVVLIDVLASRHARHSRLYNALMRRLSRKIDMFEVSVFRHILAVRACDTGELFIQPKRFPAVRLARFIDKVVNPMFKITDANLRLAIFNRWRAEKQG